jgi:hypothetical protein
VINRIENDNHSKTDNDENNDTFLNEDEEVLLLIASFAISSFF